jgi:small GTP-binding protein
MKNEITREKRASSIYFGGPSEVLTCDYILKFVVVGDSGVGKTAIIKRFADNEFLTSFAPTVGIDFKIRTLVMDDHKRIKLQIWDTAGQERFRAVNTAFYRNAMGIFAVYDVANKTSFDNVCSVWLKAIKDNCNFDCGEDTNKLPFVMLVGNKSDTERVVPTEQASAFATENNLFFMETSAKESVNVEELFIIMTKLICEKIVLHKKESYVFSEVKEEEEKKVLIKKKNKTFSLC